MRQEGGQDGFELDSGLVVGEAAVGKHCAAVGTRTATHADYIQG